MDASCASCGIAVAGSNVLFTPEAKVVCPVCFTRAEVVAAQRRARAGGSMAVVVIGVIAAILPLMLHVTTSSVVTVNGEVVQASFRDWVALGCGTVSAGCGMAGVIGARSRGSGRQLALAAVVALAGAYHIARGMGLLA